MLSVSSLLFAFFDISSNNIYGKQMAGDLYFLYQVFFFSFYVYYFLPCQSIPQDDVDGSLDGSERHCGCCGSKRIAVISESFSSTLQFLRNNLTILA
jgi:hypothetical protein